MTEEQLIQQAKNGDGTAIRALYERYATRVYSVVRRVAGDDTLAEDWSQEAWVRVIRALPSFRGESEFGTWLHRIAVNSALQGRRGTERQAAREAPLADDLPGRNGDGKALLRMRLEQALEGLPEGMRRIMVLHDVEGYTHAEIAVLLGVAPGTCKSQLFKARARMREMLQPTCMPIEEEVWNT